MNLGKHIRLLVLIVSAMFFIKHSSAQNDKPFGEIPYVRNFSVTDYNAQSHNWGAVQGDDLMMYFANDMCILEYDEKNGIRFF